MKLKFFFFSLCLLLLFNTITRFFTYNASPSIPVGLYMRAFDKIELGSVVRVPGQPYGRGRDLLKYVAALPGESVYVAQRTYVTKHRSYPPPEKTYPYKYFAGTVPPETVFVAGEHSQSYDSRYFGPVPLADLIHYKKLTFRLSQQS